MPHLRMNRVIFVYAATDVVFKVQGLGLLARRPKPVSPCELSHVAALLRNTHAHTNTTKEGAEWLCPDSLPFFFETKAIFLPQSIN
jgi:hypothetical protein